MTTSAVNTIPIVSGDEYDSLYPAIIREIVATKTNTGPVTIVTLGGSKVVFPTGSFVMGTSYEINLKIATWAGSDASFVGLLESDFTTIVTKTFSPLDISGLELWVTSNYGLTVDGSDNVAAWSDRSGNSNDFLQSNGGFKPTKIVDIFNGYPGISFDAGDKMDATNIAFGPYLSVIVVAKIDNTAGSDVGLIQQDGTFAIRAMEGSDYAAAYTWADLDTRGFGGGSGLVANTSPFILQLQYYSGSQVLYRNGAQIGSDTAQTGDLIGNTNPLRIGTGLISNLVGHVAEVMVYSSDLTAQNRTDINTYLSEKYAITLV